MNDSNDVINETDPDWVRITNDFMFVTVFSDPELCKELLEVILDKKITKISFPEGQKTIRKAKDAKSIRLDIYVEEDGKEAVYDCEMQTSSNRNLPKRSRYYQGLIDLGILKAGHDYCELKSGYVIFICPFDPFGMDEYVYRFKNRCLLSDGTYMDLDDQTEKIFVNAVGHKGKVSSKFKALMKLFAENIADDLFTKKIQNRVASTNRNEEWRLDYMTYQMRLNDVRAEGRAEGWAEGRAEGRAEGQIEGRDREKKETAMRVYLRFNSVEDAAYMAGVSVEQAEEWLEEEDMFA